MHNATIFIHELVQLMTRRSIIVQHYNTGYALRAKNVGFYQSNRDECWSSLIQQVKIGKLIDWWDKKICGVTHEKVARSEAKIVKE